MIFDGLWQINSLYDDESISKHRIHLQFGGLSLHSILASLKQSMSERVFFCGLKIFDGLWQINSLYDDE